MEVSLSFTFASLISAINTEIKKAHTDRGMVTVNLQYEQVPTGDTTEEINCKYNLFVEEFRTPIGELKNGKGVTATFSETARVQG
jgi:hypothetical protein